ncbi:MAG: hypothetical protein AB4057_15215 [Crocosphaera sp.]
MINWFLKKLRGLFFSEVPDEIAACEFECRRLECLNENFVSCPKRLQKVEDLKKLSQKGLVLDNRQRD